MQTYMSLAAITVTLAAGTISPGPCFVLVARNAVSLSRAHGFATALGMGTGVLIFSLIALLGLHAVFAAAPMLFWTLKIVGGLYLLYLAVRIIRSARQPVSRDTSILTAPKSLWQAYTLGLFTQLSNPKTVIVFAGVFSALLPEHIPFFFYPVVPILGFCIDVAWYSFVTVVLSSEMPRRTFLRCKSLFDGTAGGIMGLLGLKLIFSGN
jgi:threonine/homoserine/homoserine lactone efflux protein